MTSFLTDYGVVVALVCAGAAVLYGIIITQRLLAKSPGRARDREPKVGSHVNDELIVAGVRGQKGHVVSLAN